MLLANIKLGVTSKERALLQLSEKFNLWEKGQEEEIKPSEISKGQPESQYSKQESK